MTWPGWFGRGRREGVEGSRGKVRLRRPRRQLRWEQERAAGRLEVLEPRLLLTFEPLAPYGSLVHQEQWEADFGSSPETDSVTIDLDAGQTLSGLVLPNDPGIRASLAVSGPDSFSLGPVDATAAGDPVGFQGTPIAVAGSYTIHVTSLDGTGPYGVRLLLNAATEEEALTGVSNDTLAGAQDISASVVTLADSRDRLSVSGEIGSGDDADWYSFALAAGQRASLALSGNSFKLDLYNSAGERLAAGIAGGTQANVDQRISAYPATASDTCYAAVSGDGQYSLVVTRSMELDIEPNTRTQRCPVVDARQRRRGQPGTE